MSPKVLCLQFRSLTQPRLPLKTYGSIYPICEHNWAFLEGNKAHSHTLKIGRHRFPFQLNIGSHFPSSISLPMAGGACISYKLRAAVHRPGFAHNLHATLPITIIRSFTPDSLEYQQSSEIQNTWPGKLMYSILLPHKAWAAGDTLTALAKFVPVSKGVRVLSITSTISETVRVAIKNTHKMVSPESMRPVAIAKHEVVGGRLICISEHHYKSRVPLPYHREETSGNVSPAFGHESPAESPRSAGLSLNGGAEESNERSDDLVANLDITLPPFLTPTHHLDPITVTHRIRWSILIANLDGHTSELLCSLGIHVLDNKVLSEARAASQPTRRMLLGIYGDAEEDPGETQLPSYNAHVRDAVPTADRSDSTPSGARTPSSGLQSPSFQVHPSMHLPLFPTDAPLDWITSALSRHQLSNDRRRSENWSAPSSRLPSQLPSRASSSERGSRSSGHDSPAHPHESRGIFWNRFNAITSSFSHSHRIHSLQSATVSGQPEVAEMPTGRGRLDANTTRNSPPASPHVPTRSHFNEVPDYETASRGFAGGGVPPLTSMRGLPTYEEASVQSIIPDSTIPLSSEP